MADPVERRAAPPGGSQPTVVFRDVRQWLAHGARALPGAHTSLQLSGADVRGIRATANDFTQAQTAIDHDHDVSPDVLSEQRNSTIRQ